MPSRSAEDAAGSGALGSRERLRTLPRGGWVAELGVPRLRVVGGMQVPSALPTSEVSLPGLKGWRREESSPQPGSAGMAAAVSPCHSAWLQLPSPVGVTAVSVQPSIPSPCKRLFRPTAHPPPQSVAHRAALDSRLSPREGRGRRGWRLDGIMTLLVPSRGLLGGVSPNIFKERVGASWVSVWTPPIPGSLIPIDSSR